MTDHPAERSEPEPQASPRQVRSYISDMLAELADMARGVGDRRLEYGLRLLALDAGAPGL